MKLANEFLNQYLGEWVMITPHNGEKIKIKVIGYTLNYIKGYDKERMNWAIDLKKVKRIDKSLPPGEYRGVEELKKRLDEEIKRLDQLTEKEIKEAATLFYGHENNEGETK